MTIRTLIVTLGFFTVASVCPADDGAASIAAGGLVLMKREPRIVMAKEVLNISPSRVDVSYEFRNDTEEDVVTEVAFPIPAYGLCCDERNPEERSLEISSFGSTKRKLPTRLKFGLL